MNKGHVEFTKRNKKNSTREISTRSEMKRSGVVIDASKTRSKRNTGDIVLNKTVNIDYGGAVAKVDAGDEDEDECDYGVEEDFAVARFFRRRSHGGVEN